MKKVYSLLRASMTSDMNIFKIKQKKNSKKTSVFFPIFLSLGFMFIIWSYANALFEKMAPMHLQIVVLSLFVFLTSLMTIIEGIYKSSSLMFNCHDDQLLLSLPIKRTTVLFVRIFKFYVFELAYNSLFIIPLIVAYIRWADILNWTFYLTSLIMLFTFPIIPIALSCIIGAITSSISSRFKYKNLVQIILSTFVLLLILYLSYNVDSIFDYLIKNATSINDLITKIYYPAGLYAKLALTFDLTDLIIFTFINIMLFSLLIFILSKFYFKINSRLKKIVVFKKVSIDDLNIRSRSACFSFIKKELITFFKTPVFIINAGFGLILFLLISIILTFKFDSILPIITSVNGLNISQSLIINNLSILIFTLISATAYMTSITNSVISLEGRNINLLKSLPLKTKTMLMYKIYSGLVLTTPVLLTGNIILFIKFKIPILDMILLILLSILIPLVSHFIGLLINLKYPKLDFENSTEVVKQSISSLLSVMIGILLLIISVGIIIHVVGLVSSTLLLLIATIMYLLIDIALYVYLTKSGVKNFNNLSIN